MKRNISHFTVGNDYQITTHKTEFYIFFYLEFFAIELVHQTNFKIKSSLLSIIKHEWAFQQLTETSKPQQKYKNQAWSISILHCGSQYLHIVDRSDSTKQEIINWDRYTFDDPKEEGVGKVPGWRPGYRISIKVENRNKRGKHNIMFHLIGSKIPILAYFAFLYAKSVWLSVRKI